MKALWRAVLSILSQLLQGRFHVQGARRSIQGLLLDFQFFPSCCQVRRTALPRNQERERLSILSQLLP